MLAERLIARIRGQLELGTPDLEARSLAGEYAALCVRVRERLEQCATLVRGGNEHAAFQIAESEPDLLSLCALLSFAESERWHALCRERGLPAGFPLDGQLILSIEGLYGKEIGENHPLYRDYRDAIRTRDEDRALSVLRSIVRINPDDPNARSELSRLSAKFLRESLGKVTTLLAAHRDEDAIELMNRMERFGASELTGDRYWDEALRRRTVWLRAKAAEQVARLVTEAAEAREGNHWEPCAAALGRVRSLERDHQLNLDTAVSAQIDKLELWAGELATAAEAEAGIRASLESLTQEWTLLRQESTSNQSPAILIVRLSNWLEHAAEHAERLPEGMIREARALRQLTRSRLSRRYTILTASWVVALLCAVGGVLLWNFKASQEQTAHDRFSEAVRLIELYDHKNALSALDEFERSPAEDATRTQQALELRKRITAQVAVELRLLVEARQLAERTKALTLANLADTHRRVRAYNDEMSKVGSDLQSRLKTVFPEPDALIATCQLKLDQARTELSTLLVGLRKAMGDGDNITDIAAAVSTVDQLRLVLKTLADTGSKELDEAGAEVDRASARLEGEQKTVSALRALNQAADLKGYLAALDDAATKTAGEKSDISKRAAFVSSKAEALQNLPRSALAARVGAMWDAAATADPQGTFTPATLTEGEQKSLRQLADESITSSLHRYTIRSYSAKGIQIMRSALIAGEITEKRVPISEGFEITQRAKELTREGPLVDSTWIRREFTNNNRGGEEAAEPSTIKELELIRHVARFQDPKTGKLLEPLIRTMDRVRRSDSPFPELRAYQLQELYRLAAVRPEIWGTIFSPSAQRDAEQLRRITQNEIKPLDFLFKEKWADVQIELRGFLIRQGGAPYADEARFWRTVFGNLRNRKLVFAGMVGRDGQAVLREQLKASALYGIDNDGKPAVLFRVGADGTSTRVADAAPFSPLLRYPGTVAEAAEAAGIPKGLLAPDGGWETLLQGRDL